MGQGLTAATPNKNGRANRGEPISFVSSSTVVEAHVRLNRLGRATMNNAARRLGQYYTAYWLERLGGAGSRWAGARSGLWLRDRCGDYPPTIRRDGGRGAGPRSEDDRACTPTPRGLW